MISNHSLRRLALLIENMPEGARKREAKIHAGQAILARYFGLNDNHVKLSLNTALNILRSKDNDLH